MSLLGMVRCHKLLARLLCFALAFAVLTGEAAAQYSLDRVVVLSRHGVRSPTNSAALSEFSRSRTWPEWPVKDGYLTLAGKRLAFRIGEYYAAKFTDLGLFSTTRPLNQKQVYVWADVDQRTRQTGAGLMEGLFACVDSCPSPGHDYGDNDAMFHPVRGGVCKIDPTIAMKSILSQAGGNLDKALEPYRDTVKQLQTVLDCCRPKLCKSVNGCTLETLKSEFGVTKEGDVNLSGPIAVGSTASEVFLLQYAQGMPEVAWEPAGKSEQIKKINTLLQLHKLQFDLLQRTNYVARRQGSALMFQILETLRQTAEKNANPLRPVPRAAKFIVYVGHDTNLMNISGILGVDWVFKSGLGDKTPPAGAMAFELLHDVTGNHFVRMRYYNQTLPQMRNVTQLSPPAPPDPSGDNLPEVTGIVPHCANARDGVCPWNDFVVWVKKAIDFDCASLQPRL